MWTMTSPHSTSGPPPASSSRQLELFPAPLAESPADRHRTSRAVARASISPAWYPLVEGLYRPNNGISVTQCHELDGELVLEAASNDAEWLDLLQRISAAAARTCGCCGAEAGHLHRDHLDGPTRRVCTQCRDRLRDGESYLVIADDYWQLDGSRRAQPHSHVGRQVGATSGVRVPKRPCSALPADELRRVIAEIRAAMTADCVGQDVALARLALLGGIHVGGGVDLRGARALILGPSGVGKSLAVESLRRSLESMSFDLPWISVDALDLTSAGYSGAPSVGDLIDAALRDEPTTTSIRARKTVVVIDELHWARQIPGTGNQQIKRTEVLGSLLGLAGGGTVHFEDGREWSSQNALVIGMGAFSGLLDLSRPRRPISIRELVTAGGIPLELATRLAAQIITLSPLTQEQMIQLLMRFQPLTDLVAVCTRLGFTVRIPIETYARAALVVTLGYDGSTPRTAGGWLVSALREALLSGLADPHMRELVVAPDALPIAPTAMRPAPPGDSPDEPGDWDTTIILTRR